jgi:hypothetical protein
MTNNRRVNNSNEDSEKDTIEKLKAQNRKLLKENKKLKAELISYERAWAKTELHLKTLSDGKTLEDIFDEVSREQDEIREEENIEPVQAGQFKQSKQPIQLKQIEHCIFCKSKRIKVIRAGGHVITICEYEKCKKRHTEREIGEKEDR